jgi:hypothetical protein
VKVHTDQGQPIAEVWLNGAANRWEVECHACGERPSTGRPLGGYLSFDDAFTWVERHHAAAVIRER